MIAVLQWAGVKRGGTAMARKGACRCGGVGRAVACHGEAFTASREAST